MNKFQSIWVLALMVLAPLAALGANKVWSVATPNLPGIVYFNDGHSEEFDMVRLPYQGMSELKVRNNSVARGHSARTIKGEEISHITIWTPAFPEKKATLFYMHADKCKQPLTGHLMDLDVWGTLYAASPWGYAIRCYQKYGISEKGELQTIVTATATFKGDYYTTLIYMKCKDFKNAQLLGDVVREEDHMRFSLLPKTYVPFFASNPELAERLRNKELEGKDLQYILDEMAIYHGMMQVKQEAEPVEESVTTTVNNTEVTTTQTRNGSIGDDE